MRRLIHILRVHNEWVAAGLAFTGRPDVLNKWYLLYMSENWNNFDAFGDTERYSYSLWPYWVRRITGLPYETAKSTNASTA